MKIFGKSVHKGIFVLAIAFLLCFHVFVGESGSSPISIEEEGEVGQKFLSQIKQQFEVLDDDFANEYITDLGQYLLTGLETRPFPFHFYVIKDNHLNAFAGPGGHIFVFSGLVDVMDRADELAAVLCHEIGHVAARHLAQRIEQNKKIGLATLAGVLAGILVGGKAGGAIATGSTAAAVQAQLSYSRDDERQADQLGVKYMEAAGFDPAGMIDTLRELQRGEWAAGDQIPEYLQTHPGGPERMSNIEIMLSHYSPPPINEQVAKLRELFPFFKALLMAKCLEPQEAERLLSIDLQKDAHSGVAHFGLGILFKEGSEYPRAADQFEKALRAYPNSLPILRNLGETYHLMGQDSKAIVVLEKALELSQQDKSALFLLAISYQGLEQYPKSIRLFERLTLMKPVKDQVFYQLGLSYGRENKLAHAHYNFWIYFRRLGMLDKARYHLKKAEELAGDDPDLKSRIQRAIEELHKTEPLKGGHSSIRP